MRTSVLSARATTFSRARARTDRKDQEKVAAKLQAATRAADASAPLELVLVAAAKAQLQPPIPPDFSSWLL